MRFQLTPGNSLACRINTHRAGWAGAICETAENWNCLAPQDFREDYCARQDPRCFHLNAFDPASPSIVIEENGASWLLAEEPDALNDQILILWGVRATTARGVPDQNQRKILFGAYRVQSVATERHGYRSRWRVRPYADGWVRLAELLIPMPRYEKIGGPYINQLEANDVARVFSGDANTSQLDAADTERYRKFCKGYPQWIRAAREKANTLVNRLVAATWQNVRSRASASCGLENKALKGLRGLLPANLPLQAEAAASPAGHATAAAQPTSSRPECPALDPGAAEWIRETLGEDLFLELSVAFATRSFVILRGDPGVGKSYLALHLLDDPERERTLVVAVSATWRGREDLLGYVNPVDGQFIKTPFTQFLERAATAWKAGDQRAWIVLFEEFNLSQPEHWLSDVLAVSQFEQECDRKIQLAGESSRDASSVFLSPALRFVATVNSDHTTRSLSPRVLDRAAVVPLELTAKGALQRIGLQLSDSSATAIADVDFVLRPKGASFSLRSAHSLADCLGSGLVEDENTAVDLILVQQVLSKVRLNAHDPMDLSIMRDLEHWCEQLHSPLLRCSAVIASWREKLDAGMDILQA